MTEEATNPSGPPRPTVERVARGATVVSAVLLAVLVGSGLILIARYQPDPGGGQPSPAVLHLSHVVAAALVGPAVVVVMIARVLHAVSAHRAGAPRRVVPAWLAAGAWVLVTLTLLTGPYLVWDQLNLVAASVGNRAVPLPVRGFPTGIAVRSFVVDGHLVSPGTLRGWLTLHVGMGLLACALLAASFRRRSWRRARPADGASRPDPRSDAEPAS